MRVLYVADVAVVVDLVRLVHGGREAGVAEVMLTRLVHASLLTGRRCHRLAEPFRAGVVIAQPLRDVRRGRQVDRRAATRDAPATVPYPLTDCPSTLSSTRRVAFHAVWPSPQIEASCIYLPYITQQHGRFRAPFQGSFVVKLTSFNAALCVRSPSVGVFGRESDGRMYAVAKRQDPERIPSRRKGSSHELHTQIRRTRCSSELQRPPRG